MAIERIDQFAPTSVDSGEIEFGRWMAAIVRNVAAYSIRKMHSDGSNRSPHNPSTGVIDSRSNFASRIGLEVRKSTGYLSCAVLRHHFTNPIGAAIEARPSIAEAGLLIVDFNGNQLVEKYWGNFDRSSRIPIGSATKWLSAGVMMSLVDDGSLNLDRPVGEVLPTFAGQPNGKSEMTVRQMFSREGNPLLGEHLASHGFVCLHLQHEGTDDRAFRRSPRSIAIAANAPEASADRFRDVAFAVSRSSKETSSMVFAVSSTGKNWNLRPLAWRLHEPGDCGAVCKGL